MGKIATIVATFIIASAILSVSILRSAVVRRVFSQSPSPSPSAQIVEVEYEFAYPGKITPESPLWVFKVVRDKLWLLVTANPTKKAEVLLLFADKRLATARFLFEEDSSEKAVATLTKAEKYLEQAVNQERVSNQKGNDTSQVLLQLSQASLKHRQVIEQLMEIAPEDAKPVMVEAADYPKRLFEQTKVSLGEMGISAPENPFEEAN